MIIHDTDLLTRRQAEELLGLTKRSLDKLAHRKSGPPYYRFSARVIRYTPADLIRWRDEQLVVAQ